MKYSKKGFSLVELIIAMALMGIIAGIAAPAFHRHHINANLKSAARDITSDFAMLKERAISEGVRYRMVFNPASDNYILQQGNQAGTVYVNFSTKLPSSLGSDISMTSAAFGAGTTVTFQNRGTATAGNVVLTNSRGSTATITSNITGRTHVQFNLQ